MYTVQLDLFFQLMYSTLACLREFEQAEQQRYFLQLPGLVI